MTLKNVFGDIALDSSVQSLVTIVSNVLTKLNLDSLPSGASTSSLQQSILEAVVQSISETEGVSASVNALVSHIDSIKTSTDLLGKETSIQAVKTAIDSVKTAIDGLSVIANSLGTESELDTISSRLASILSKLNQDTLPTGAATETSLQTCATLLQGIDSAIQTLSGVVSTEAELETITAGLASILEKLNQNTLPVGAATENTLANIEVATSAINSKTANNQTYAPVIAYDSYGKIIYLGHAVPGSLTENPAWRIQKFYYDGSGNLTGIKYAGGHDTFVNIWDNRESLTYL